jgi:1,4-dihydroxy-2-naphthoate octaprenyltransferase
MMNNSDTPSFPSWKIWWLAIRPRTLPAAASGVITATALAWRDGGFRLWPALAALGVALSLQIGSNLANDVFDFERGVDTAERQGPLRVTQARLLKPAQVKLGMAFVLLVAAGLGLYLAWVSSWNILWIGLAAIVSAVAYTGGPFPLGNYGLGDLFVFIFFGPVAVAGTYYVQARSTSPGAWGMSVLIGLIVTAILVVNNLRDIATDGAAGRRTLAVRWGAEWTRREYLLCLVVAYAALPLFAWLGWVPWTALLSWGSLVVAWPVARIVFDQQGQALNAALAGTGRIALVYSLLFALGLLLGSLKL